MKINILIPLVALKCVVFMPQLNATPAQLNASELAYHLNCVPWVSQFRLTDKIIGAEIYAIRDGKVDEVLIGSPAFPTDRDLTRIAIIASPQDAAVELSIQIEAAPKTRKKISQITLQTVVPLPTILTEGDYVLGGVPIDHAFPKDIKSLEEINAAQFREGLLLRIKQ